MAYLQFAAQPAPAPPGVPGGPAGFGAAPEPRELIGFAASDPADTRRQLAALVAALRAAEQHATEVLDDFPASHHGDYAEMLATLTDLDSAGPDAPAAAADPAAGGRAVLGFERAVVDFCTDLALGDRRHTHGYVTGGGAEGLLVGLRAGRDALPGAPLYVSAAGHQAARCQAGRLGMDVVEVPYGRNGAMDPEALRLLAAERPGGAVVLATIAGTAADGGDDDLAAIRAAARIAGPVHVHVDATHTGLLAPFSPQPVAWDLRDGADSLSLSAHRLLGLPVPCGVVLVGTDRARAVRTHGSTPNPLAVALLWSALRDRGYDGLRALVHDCYDTARYAADHLTEAGYRTTRGAHGLTLRFPRPAAAVCTRWRLATDGPHARLTALPPLTRATVDALCRDLSAGISQPAGPSFRPASGGGRNASVGASQRDG
ncbi:histidine decarboxylase [Streptomyces sp. NBC_01198]|uniref:histidine decarboxylase n=1 Tax=Streptomyces sp. NBC_01198 TaxID=2903769 RepID=UPI002E11148D|nr:pyridoxal-dependent decarboxylase [Streptomyces sp. NBC_01198]